MTTHGETAIDLIEMEKAFKAHDISGLKVHSELIRKAGLLPASDMLDGWNVSVAPSLERIKQYQRLLLGFASILSSEMLRNGKFTPEATGIARGWMKTRYVDRLAINYESFLGAKFLPTDDMKELELRAIDGRATPAENLLSMHSRQAVNRELGRVAAPTHRPTLVAEMELGMMKSVELLGGQLLDQRDKFKIEEQEILQDGSILSRVHDRTDYAVMRDGTYVSRRIAFVTRTTGEIDYNELSGEELAEIPTSVQSDLFYAHNNDYDAVSVYSRL